MKRDPATAAPFIVISAPNGARRTRQDHPALPLTAAQLADCAAEIAAAGAAIMHLHVRDAAGRHTLSPERYRAAITAIRKRVGSRLVLQITTEACGMYSRDEQMTLVRELQPEAVSLALRELCPDAASEVQAAEFFRWLESRAIMPQYILYSTDEAARFATLCRRGIIPAARAFVLLVLGRYGVAAAGEPAGLEAYCDALGTPRPAWAVCCFGVTEDRAVRMAAETGGHGRVGFENNLRRPDGSLAMDNAELIRLAAAHAEAAGRTLASAHDVRNTFA